MVISSQASQGCVEGSETRLYGLEQSMETHERVTSRIMEKKTKMCIECKEEKDLEDFYVQRHKRKSKKRGEYILETYSSYCKICDRNKSKRVKDSEAYKERANKRKRDRLRNDPEYREKVNFQKRASAWRNRKYRLWKGAKDRAERDGLPFDITIDDIFIPDMCPILNVFFVPGTSKDYRYTPSLDKIIPEKGYVKGNIAVITNLANVMKNSASPEELRAFAANIGKYLDGDIVQPPPKEEGGEVEDKEP